MDEMELVKLVRSAEISITGKRFCSSCQSMQSAALGKMTEGKKVNRWQCYSCSIYTFMQLQFGKILSIIIDIINWSTDI